MTDGLGAGAIGAGAIGAGAMAGGAFGADAAVAGFFFFVVGCLTG